MKKNSTKILIDEKNRIFLKSDDLSVSHILTEEDYNEMLSFYKRNHLTSIINWSKDMKKMVVDLGLYYIFKDKNGNIFGDTLMNPLNETGTIGQIIPLLVSLPNEEVYKTLYEFLCFAAKCHAYKRLTVSISTHEEYELLLKLGFVDFLPEHVSKIKIKSIQVKTGLINMLNNYFSVQIGLSKMPATNLELTAEIKRI